MDTAIGQARRINSLRGLACHASCLDGGGWGGVTVRVFVGGHVRPLCPSLLGKKKPRVRLLGTRGWEFGDVGCGLGASSPITCRGHTRRAIKYNGGGGVIELSAGCLFHWTPRTVRLVKIAPIAYSVRIGGSGVKRYSGRMGIFGQTA